MTTEALINDYIKKKNINYWEPSVLLNYVVDWTECTVNPVETIVWKAGLNSVISVFFVFKNKKHCSVLLPVTCIYCMCATKQRHTDDWTAKFGEYSSTSHSKPMSHGCSGKSGNIKRHYEPKYNYFVLFIALN